MSQFDPDQNDIDIFVPDFNLQGEKFPFYILWKKKLKGITLEYSSGLAPSSLNNVSPNDIRLGSHSIYLEKTEVDGYLSGLFEGTFDKIVPEKDESIRFSAHLDIMGSVND